MVITDIYNFIIADGDVKESKTLAKDIKTVVPAIVVYVLLVKCLIPWIMKNRKPFGLKGTLITYNLLISLLNGIMTYQLFCYIVEYWNIRCTVRKAPREVYAKYVTQGFKLIWYMSLTKYVEWLDTIFFALRKKNRQITHLHLFHHAVIVLIPIYGFQQKLPPFYYVLAAAINSSVHVIMYSYYGLAAIGPHVQKYLWWKKYLTLVQITQFLVILGYALIGFLNGCEQFESFEITLFIFVSIILTLFINFYIKSYRQKKSC